MRITLMIILGTLVILFFSASYSLALDMGTKSEIENLRKHIDELEKGQEMKRCLQKKLLGKKVLS